MKLNDVELVKDDIVIEFDGGDTITYPSFFVYIGESKDYAFFSYRRNGQSLSISKFKRRYEVWEKSLSVVLISRDRDYENT